MLREDFFTDRINRMYDGKETIGSLSKQELYQKIERFKADDNAYFTSINDNKRLKFHVDEFDFLICLLSDFYTYDNCDLSRSYVGVFEPEA